MKKKPDPVVEKLDEILKTLRRIEAKPAAVPVYVNPFPFVIYPPVVVQPHPTYPRWEITCGTGLNNTTSANVPMTFTNAGMIGDM